MWKMTIQSPVGTLQAFASEIGLRGLIWPESEDPRFAESNRYFRSQDLLLFKNLKMQLDEYFAGTRQQFDLPLDLVGTEFQCTAWNALQQIPFGETRTYSEQAKIIGRPKACRAVGAANGKNPISIVIPCHRVVGADGSLTGFAGGIEVKRFLLDHETAFMAANL